MKFTGVELKLGNQHLHLAYAIRDGKGEMFYLDSEDKLDLCLIAHDEKIELFLSPFTPEFNSNEGLNIPKDSLVDLYTTIRNHPSCRLKMLSFLGPIKQY